MIGEQQEDGAQVSLLHQQEDDARVMSFRDSIYNIPYFANKPPLLSHLWLPSLMLGSLLWVMNVDDGCVLVL